MKSNKSTSSDKGKNEIEKHGLSYRVGNLYNNNCKNYNSSDNNNLPILRE